MTTIDPDITEKEIVWAEFIFSIDFRGRKWEHTKLSSFTRRDQDKWIEAEKKELGRYSKYITEIQIRKLKNLGEIYET